MSDPQGQGSRYYPMMARMPGAETPPRELLYPAAPITLREAVAAQEAGTRVGKPLRGFNWWFLDSLAMFFAFFVCAAIAVALVGVSPNGWSLIVLQVVPWIGLAGFPVLLTVLAGNGPRIDLGLRWAWRDIVWGIAYGVLSLVVASIIAYITTKISGEFSSAAGDVGEGLKSNPPLLITFVLLIAVGAPIVEEIAFRGQIFNSIAKFRIWPILTVLLSAAIFAGFHFEAVRFALLFGVGTVLGIARWHTGSLTTSIVAHMCNNLPGAVFLLMQ